MVPDVDVFFFGGKKICSAQASSLLTHLENWRRCHGKTAETRDIFLKDRFQDSSQISQSFFRFFSKIQGLNTFQFALILVQEYW